MSAIKYTYLIRPNDDNPDWPTKPDLALLAAMQQRPNESKGQFANRVLKETQNRLLTKHRDGCGSDNLDWVKMVSNLRKCTRQLSQGTNCRFGAWIDGLLMDSQISEKTRYVAYSSAGKLQTSFNDSRYKRIVFTFKPESI